MKNTKQELIDILPRLEECPNRKEIEKIIDEYFEYHHDYSAPNESWDITKSYCGKKGEDNMKADIKEIMFACGDKFEFLRLVKEAKEELDEAAFDLDQESRMNGV